MGSLLGSSPWHIGISGVHSLMKQCVDHNRGPSEMLAEAQPIKIDLMRGVVEYFVGAAGLVVADHLNGFLATETRC